MPHGIVELEQNSISVGLRVAMRKSENNGLRYPRD